MDSAIPRNYVEYMEHINRNFRDKTAIYEKKDGEYIYGKNDLFALIIIMKQMNMKIIWLKQLV